MLKTLKEIQAENRRLILEAAHGRSYEEALQKELQQEGCKVVLDEKGYPQLTIEENYYSDWRATQMIKFFGVAERPLDQINFKEIIGKPITLSRVLLAFGKKKIHYLGNRRCENLICLGDIDSRVIWYWNLEIETLEEQSEETQRAIYQLLTQ